MSTRPAAPDPQRDRHVAFPDEAPVERLPTTLPSTAWASAPGTRLQPPPRPRSRRPRRLSVGWVVVAAVVGFPLVSGTFSMGTYSDAPMGGQYGDSWDAGSSGFTPPDFTVLSGLEVAGVQPDQQTFAVPAGTTTYRVEVAGGDPRGTLQVVAAHGDASVPETAMPFAVEVHTDEPDTLQWVVAHGTYGQAEIQCRVYVGEDLVALNTGQGMTECALPPA